MKQFVPFDDAWFDHPEQMPERLVPYQYGLPCRHRADQSHSGQDPARSEHTVPDAQYVRSASRGH